MDEFAHWLGQRLSITTELAEAAKHHVVIFDVVFPTVCLFTNFFTIIILKIIALVIHCIVGQTFPTLGTYNV